MNSMYSLNSWSVTWKKTGSVLYFSKYTENYSNYTFSDQLFILDKHK